MVTRRYLAIAVSSGLFTGILAGLVGLGGAEERVPFILYGLGVPVYDMVVANLIISFGTSGLNFALRAQANPLSVGDLYLSLAMIAGSIVGAFFGATVSHRISERKLKALLAVVLTLVIIRLTASIFTGIPSSGVSFTGAWEWALAAFFGLLIGLISGSIGVAGGEYRIPVLIFAFGIPIKVAGTVSQLVSLPTIAAGFLQHRKLGFLSRKSLTLAAVMGVPSLVGVAISRVILASSSDGLIRAVLIAILLYSVARIVLELRSPPVKKGA